LIPPDLDLRSAAVIDRNLLPRDRGLELPGVSGETRRKDERSRNKICEELPKPPKLLPQLPKAAPAAETAAAAAGVSTRSTTAAASPTNYSP